MVASKTPLQSHSTRSVSQSAHIFRPSQLPLCQHDNSLASLDPSQTQVLTPVIDHRQQNNMQPIDIKSETIVYRTPQDPCNRQLDEREWPTLPIPGQHTAPALPQEKAEPTIVAGEESPIRHIPLAPHHYQLDEQEWPALPTTGQRTAPAVLQEWPVLPMVEYRIAPVVPLNELPVGPGSRLLRLPAEIRNIIYAMVLPSCPADFEDDTPAAPISCFPEDGADWAKPSCALYEGPGIISFSREKFRMKGLGLSRVNKQLRSEVLPMVWAVYHTLVIVRYYDEAEVTRCLFERLGDVNCTLLERVVFVVDGNAIDVKRQEDGSYGMAIMRDGFAKESLVEGAIARVGRYLELYREKTSFGWREWADVGEVSYAMSWEKKPW